MTKELKPCPACGARRNVDIIPGQVVCWDCLCRGSSRHRTDDAVKQWNALPRRLRWTNEPPKEPGWYWHEENHGGKHPAHVFRVVTSTKETGIYVRFFGQPADVIHKIDHISGKWAGPIPEPEERQ